MGGGLVEIQTLLPPPSLESVTLPLKLRIFLRERLQWINCRASALGGVDTKTLVTNRIPVADYLKPHLQNHCIVWILKLIWGRGRERKRERVGGSRK